jgi:hypothetical protein
MRHEGHELFQQDLVTGNLAGKYYVRIRDEPDFRWEIFGLTAD